MQTISLSAVRVVLTAMAGAALTLGCATPPKEPAPTDYGFFSEFPNLKRISAARGVFLYINPNRPLRDYQKFIVDLSGIYFQPGSAYWISMEKSDELARSFRQEVIASLSKSYPVVEKPGPGVLRMSLTLGDVRTCRPDVAATSGRQRTPGHQPVLWMLLRDSYTGEEVVLLRDITRGSEFAEAVEKRGDAGAKELFHQWAQLITDKINEARQKGTPMQSSTQPSTQP